MRTSWRKFFLFKDPRLSSVKIKIKRKKIPENKRKEARELVIRRLEYFNETYNLKFHKVFIRSQKTRWGSCSSQGNLNFNFRIIELESDLQDYIIVHELCHLKHFNHGTEFWEMVSIKIPNYKYLKKRLAKFQ